MSADEEKKTDFNNFFNNISYLITLTIISFVLGLIVLFLFYITIKEALTINFVKKWVILDNTFNNPNFIPN